MILFLVSALLRSTVNIDDVVANSNKTLQIKVMGHETSRVIINRGGGVMEI